MRVFAAAAALMIAGMTFFVVPDAALGLNHIIVRAWLPFALRHSWVRQLPQLVWLAVFIPSLVTIISRSRQRTKPADTTERRWSPDRASMAREEKEAILF